MPLCRAGNGEEVTCVELSGGQGVRRHMADLGIIPGTRMRVISGGHEPGPVIISVRGAKLMLGKGMAHSILVRPD
jgi:ferrous iron transport protein A